jgi:hypothetical protein
VDVFYGGGQVGFGLTAMEDGDIMACVGERTYSSQANEACAPDYKNAHSILILSGIYLQDERYTLFSIARNCKTML